MVTTGPDRRGLQRDNPHAGLLALEGIGWDGDLDQMRYNGSAPDGWLNRPLEDDASANTP